MPPATGLRARAGALFPRLARRGLNDRARFAGFGTCLTIEGYVGYAAKCAESCYSIRNASIGEMAAARLAGIMAAKNAQIDSEPAAKASANGSQLETP